MATDFSGIVCSSSHLTSQENACRHPQDPLIACGLLFFYWGMWKPLAKNPAKACLLGSAQSTAFLLGWGRRAGQGGPDTSSDFSCIVLPVHLALLKNLVLKKKKKNLILEDM